MSTFTLRNTAAEIDSAISRVASADTEPKSNSANMVTSGGVKQYVDAINVGANSFLAPLVARINALSTPEILSFDNFQNYPFAQQGVRTSPSGVSFVAVQDLPHQSLLTLKPVSMLGSCS